MLNNVVIKNDVVGTSSLMVLWLRLCASSAGGTGSIPGPGNKIPHAAWQGQKKKMVKNDVVEVYLWNRKMSMTSFQKSI